MDGLSDEDLMLEVKQGNTYLLTRLFERHQKYLFNFFLSTGVKYHQSEDFVQQAFYRILKYRNSYQEDANFKRWMFTIARNIIRRHFEKQNGELVTELPSKLFNQPDDSDDLEKEEKIRMLYRALEKIPPSDRELISLSRFQGMKYENIAEITGTSVGAIKIKMHRALKKLREQYFEKA